jgi:hypothetical protein
MEMRYNLKRVNGFKSRLGEMASDQIESTYASLEIARMLITMTAPKSIFVSDRTTGRLFPRRKLEMPFFNSSQKTEARLEAIDLNRLSQTMRPPTLLHF